MTATRRALSPDLPNDMAKPGTYWCAIASYHDGSGPLGVFGPYRTQQYAEAHAAQLRDVGVHPNEKWETLPLRRIELGEQQ